MVVIVGLIALVVALIVGMVGVLSNAGPTHPLSEDFSVFGYHLTGSTGTLFLFGIVIGAVALLGLSVLLARACHTADRGRDPVCSATGGVDGGEPAPPASREVSIWPSAMQNSQEPSSDAFKD